MEINHQYLLELAETTRKAWPTVRILDFGCGKGEFVEAGRNMGLDIFGTDVINPGTEEALCQRPQLVPWIRTIKDAKIPFDNESFDLVVSNMVFEHVHDYATVAAEIHRVMKPGGFLVALFPTLDTWREGHIGIPFSHRISSTRLRWAYTIFLRSMGMGLFKTSPPREWTTEKLNYLDTHTKYRWRSTIEEITSPYFQIRWMEHDCAAYRVKKSRARLLAPLLSIPLARWMMTIAFRRLAFSVLVAHKAAAGKDPTPPWH